MLRRRRPLPILGGGHTHEFHKCNVAFHNACFAAPSNTTGNPTFRGLAQKVISRRQALKAGAVGAAGAAVSLGGPLAGVAAADSELHARGIPGRGYRGTLGFAPIEPNIESEFTVPPGYAHRLLIAWGDPLFGDAPAFDFDDPASRIDEADARWFGYNNDYSAYFALRGISSRHGVLWVNHEYVDANWSTGGIQTLLDRAAEAEESGDSENEVIALRRDVALAAMAAIGGSVLEVQRGTGADRSFSYIRGSRFNRRITARTPMRIAGPVGGSPWVRGSHDVHGMVGNCAGGVTPWGTVLSAEENFQGYFNATLFSEEALATKLGFKMLVEDALVDATVGLVHERYGVTGEGSGWENAEERWGEAWEPFRFGYIVEIDPRDPDCLPRKRTKMGRMKHEGAASILTKDGRCVSYLGDDETFDYLYKFVTAEPWEPHAGVAGRNADLLDAGTLHVARFEEEDTDIETGARGRWIPLTPETRTIKGGTLGELGWDEAAIAAFSRGAADLVGATKMDRPEDVQASPVTGRVYLMCTNNSDREDPNDPNPRAPNEYGHVIEIREDGDDNAATRFSWTIPLAGGEPGLPYEEGGLYTVYSGGEIAPMGSPDNCTFDNNGNLWIATDGRQPLTIDGMPTNDGFFAMPVEGEQRGNLQLFATVPQGAETCGPLFTPDMGTLFLSAQHPNPPWPDGDTDYARPGVVSIWKAERGDWRIGT